MGKSQRDIFLIALQTPRKKTEVRDLIGTFYKMLEIIKLMILKGRNVVFFDSQHEKHFIT